MMKIAVVAPTYLPARRANTIQVMKMAQALALCGHTIRLAAPRMGPVASEGPGSRQWPVLARHYGLRRSFPVDWLPASQSGRRYDYALRALRWARSWKADLLYTRLPQAAALASLLGIPTIFEVHDLPQGRMGPLVFRLFLKGRGARRLVTITQALTNELSLRLGAPGGPPFTVTAPDGVDLERYNGLPEPEAARHDLFNSGRMPTNGLSGWGFTAGYTGHLYPGRGRRLLLELAARLPEITFLLVGGEPQDVLRMRTEARARGLKNVVLTGFVPNSDLPLYQAACDVLLAPYGHKVAASSGGNIAPYLSPMKLFEYLASGRAILCSDLPVLREVMTGENSVLLPPGEPDAWAASIASLQADPERRLRLGAQGRCDAYNYSWERRAGHILDGVKLLR